VISQPAVSDHLRSLEAAVGAELLYWEGRTLRVTGPGEIIYDLACTVVARSSEAHRTIEGLSLGEEGRVVIGATSTIATYRLPPILIASSLTAPRISISLEAYASDRVLQAVLDGRCDFGVVMAGSTVPGLPLVTEPIGEEQLVLVTSTGSPSSRTLTYDEVGQLDFVCGPTSQERRNQIDTMLRLQGVSQRRVQLELAHPEAVKAAVRRGVGAAFLYRCSVAEELESGQLARVHVTGPPMSTPVALWFRERRRFSAAQRSMMDLIRESFAPPRSAGDR